MGEFRKGAFALADELQLPVVPLTINGSFDILPRQRGFNFVNWHPLSLTIHQPIYPVGQGTENMNATLRQAYDSVMSASNQSIRELSRIPTSDSLNHFSSHASRLTPHE